MQVGVRLGRVRKRKGRALRVEVRLGRVRRREGGISASRSKAWEGVTGENTGYKGLAGANEAWEGPQVERRALRVRIRLGRACKRAGKVL
jgi:hypothetical protein